MIFGTHCGLPEEGHFALSTLTKEDAERFKTFCHSPESWKKLWEDIFGKGKVDVQVSLDDLEEGDDAWGTFPGNTNRMYEMKWSVIRL